MIWRRRRRGHSAGVLTRSGSLPLYAEWVPGVAVAEDPAEANWLLPRLTPWGRDGVWVSSIVPTGFSAYARIDHAHDEGNLPQDLAAAVVEVLRGHTTTPDHCWLAVWEGWGDLPPARATVHHPARGYVLLSAAIAAAAQPLWQYTNLSGARDQSPSLWWPADRAWCVATEIDMTWTYVAGSAQAVAAVVSDPRLDARTVAPSESAT